MDPIVLKSVLHTVGIGATVAFIIVLIVIGFYLYESYLTTKNLKLDNELKQRELAR